MDNPQIALAPNRVADPRVDALGAMRKPRGLLSDTFLRVRKNPGAIAGLIVMVLIILVSVFAPLIAPYDPIRQDTQAIRHGPALDHLFGTDSFGRDILSRVMYGGRYSLPVGLVAVAVASFFGVLAGLAAGYYGRWVDSVIMRVVDMMLAFPGILLVMAIVAILGGSLFNLMLAVGLSAIPDYTRVVRGSVLAVRESEYITAGRVLGASNRSLMLRHILPNVLPPIIVLATLGIAGAIILGSTLSFLGLGVQPPTPEWGSMLSDGRTVIRNSWWVSFFPGLAIATTVLAINLLGDGLRDALDPRRRH